MSKLILAVSAAVSIFLASSSSFAQSINLTGVWSCNDGATYYVRQIGNEIWWYGENSQTAPSFSNVAHGTLATDNKMYLVFVDVPKGTNLGRGGLLISVSSATRFQALDRSGFGGSVWTKIR